MPTPDIHLSIVIPVYNSGASVVSLVDDLYRLYKDHSLQVVLVNDGSEDDSGKYCDSLAARYQDVLHIELRRNFGEHNAVMCGLNHIAGDFVVIMDDDYQNPPEELLKLIQAAEEHDVVYSRYTEKQHHFVRNMMSKINDMFATWLMDKPRGLYLSSFKLIRREVADEIIKYHGPFPYIDGLILRATSSLGVVEVEHNKRESGQSNYTIRKLVHLWLNMFVNFSIKPMRVMVLSGMTVAAASFMFGVMVIVEKINYPETEVGWASIMVAITMLFGVQFIFMGMIGEYLGKQYLDQNGTPQWVIRKKVR